VEPPSRRRLIEAQLPLVRSVALRFAGSGEPLDDLVQVGCIGLIKAVDRYDPARGLPLEPYAVAAIAGEIRHHLRDRVGLVRLPRRLGEAGVRVHYEPLAADDRLAAADPVAAADDRVALGRAFLALDPRERRLLALRFYGDLSQAQVARRLDLSPVHVSRLLHRALGKLRVELDGLPTNDQTSGLAVERDAA
jgi:RNA polymerase sigma-B factor